jgi:hypothetical protein
MVYHMLVVPKIYQIILL